MSNPVLPLAPPPAKQFRKESAKLLSQVLISTHNTYLQVGYQDRCDSFLSDGEAVLQLHPAGAGGDTPGLCYCVM